MIFPAPFSNTVQSAWSQEQFCQTTLEKVMYFGKFAPLREDLGVCHHSERDPYHPLCLFSVPTGKLPPCWAENSNLILGSIWDVETENKPHEFPLFGDTMQTLPLHFQWGNSIASPPSPAPWSQAWRDVWQLTVCIPKAVGNPLISSAPHEQWCCTL